MTMARQSRAPTILLTRPQAQSRRFAQELRQVTDLPVLIAPLMEAHVLAPDLPKASFRAVILTSETGAAAAGQLAGLPRRAICVGQRTADAARAAGFLPEVAGPDADGLVATLLARPEAGPLLHLRGRDASGAVAERLTMGGIVTESAIVYEQIAQPLGPEARALLAGEAAVLVPLFSPRSARLLAAAVAEGPLAPLGIAALSPAVAEAARDLPHHWLETAEHPDAAAMCMAVQRLIASACGP